MTVEGYRGREQSYIKHLFLTDYLQAAAYKILQGRSPKFNFVDAFAGPWQVSNDDLSDASFDQALRTLETVRADLDRRGISSLKISFCFCERRKEAAVRLRKYARDRSSFEIHVFHGAFEDRLTDIAAVCREGFTFTFLDPTGWNIRSGPVLQFLRERRGEFLLNFMAEHVNRHAGYAPVVESFGRFLANPEWTSEFDSLPQGWSNEKRVLHLLRDEIKGSEAATYVPDFPIRKPRENRIKMRLLLGTNSAKGLEVFRDVQEKVERRELEMRDQLRSENRRQPSFFAPDEIAAIEQEAVGIGSQAFRDQAEQRMIDGLTERDSENFHNIAIDIMENVPMRLTHVKRLAVDMRRRRLISFELPPRRRVPQPETRIALVGRLLLPKR